MPLGCSATPSARARMLSGLGAVRCDGSCTSWRRAGAKSAGSTATSCCSGSGNTHCHMLMVPLLLLGVISCCACLYGVQAVM